MALHAFRPRAQGSLLLLLSHLSYGPCADAVPSSSRVVSLLKSSVWCECVWLSCLLVQLSVHTGVLTYGVLHCHCQTSLCSAHSICSGSVALDMGRCVTHSSDSVDAANREVELWFPEGVVQFDDCLAAWVKE